MEIIRFFCLILATSLLIAQTGLTQEAVDTAIQVTDGTTKKELTTESTIKEATTTKLAEVTTETTHSSTEPPTTPSSTHSSTEPTKSTTAITTIETTPVPPSTTPKPADFTWELKDKDENHTVCLIIKAELSFKNTNGTWDPFALPSNASVDKASDCHDGNNSQILILTSGDITVNLTFEKKEVDKDTNKFSLSYLTFSNKSDVHVLNGSDKDYMVAHMKKSYLCNDDETHDMSNDYTVTWKNVQVQAFMDKEDAGKFGKEEECGNDQTSDIVPIAVGCALAALVVVVLIAYLVGRRRSRQKGYQSV